MFVIVQRCLGWERCGPDRPGRNQPYDILVAGEITIHSSAVGGTSTPLLGIWCRGVEHVHRLRWENRRFSSSTSATCAAPSTAAVWSHSNVKGDAND